MAIRIVPHGAERTAGVEAFNARMLAAGSKWGFYTNPVPDWIPKQQPGQTVWREFHLAVDDDETVRGGYGLKPQDWLIRGETHVVTDWQGPVSEGAISPTYGALGLRLVRDMLKKRPLLYSWGHGGDDQPIVQMIEKMGWLLHGTPFCLRVLRPRRFLRLNALLRGTARRRLALDALAFSGAGSIGLRVLHTAIRLRSPRRFRAKAEEFATFGPWADTLWDACKDKYTAIAFRDAASMNTLLPSGAWPPVIRLRVQRDGVTLGWAIVMDTQMKDDARFGTLRVGSIVDCLADPEAAGEVVAAASRFLRKRGVDILVSNQAHPAWAEGFAQNGYVVLPNRRLFAASPALKAAMEPFAETARGLHLTNMDGHGPMAL